jgi:hypothetical protein
MDTIHEETKRDHIGMLMAEVKREITEHCSRMFWNTEKSHGKVHEQFHIDDYVHVMRCIERSGDLCIHWLFAFDTARSEGLSVLDSAAQADEIT